jgi:hypothetical protein
LRLGGPSASISFDLVSLAPPVGIAAGAYTLTFVADSTCDQIPNELRTFSWPATVVPGENEIFVFLSDSPSDLDIGVAGNTLAFMLEDPLVKHIPPNTYLEVGGSSIVSVDTPNVSAVTFPFDGTLDYCVLKSPSEDFAPATPCPSMGSCTHNAFRAVIG